MGRGGRGIRPRRRGCLRPNRAGGVVAVGIPGVEHAEAVGGVLEVTECAAAFDGAPELVGGGGFGERFDKALHVAVFVEIERGGQGDGAVGARAEFAGAGEFGVVPIGDGITVLGVVIGVACGDRHEAILYDVDLAGVVIEPSGGFVRHHFEGVGEIGDFNSGHRNGGFCRGCSSKLCDGRFSLQPSDYVDDSADQNARE